MSAMSVLAILAVGLAVGTWLGIRWAEANQHINRTLHEVLWSMPVDEWQKQCKQNETELQHAIDRERWRWR